MTAVPDHFDALDIAQHGTPERKAAAVEAFRMAVTRSNPDNPWEHPAGLDRGNPRQ